MVTYLKINGVVMPTPKSYIVLLSDLDSEKTSRSELGYLKRDRIRANVYKINLEWRVQQKDVIVLRRYLSNSSFNATFYDPTLGGYVIAKMYAGDKEFTLVQQNDDPAKEWWDVTCNLIEY